jgi:hypothetical protein
MTPYISFTGKRNIDSRADKFGMANQHCSVCVLEDVKPVPRYLLYLRPRLED